jgi:hypothetical protein
VFILIIIGLYVFYKEGGGRVLRRVRANEQEAAFDTQGGGDE